MVGTVLLILSEGFDDMAFLANQVILEEAGNDVITASSSGGAVKGLDSSVMTVKFQDAIQHDVQFDAIVLV
ncbi:MAG: DJ-1 family glyoxalase III, partial [Candidatus Kariarchaeaceae archaeon]